MPTETSYGARRPADIEFEPDCVIVNTNIRNEPFEDEQTGEPVDNWVADATRLSNQEYQALKKQADEQAKAAADEVFLEMDADICNLYDLIEGGA